MDLVELTEVKNRLIESGLKVTHQRIVLLRALHIFDGHPSAENIYEAVRENNPSLSLSTVYRVLEDFEKAGLINKVATRKGIQRFDSNTNPHNHIYCTNTHDIYDFYDEELNELITDFFRKRSVKNFRITDIKLQVNGEKLNPDQKVLINNNHK